MKKPLKTAAWSGVITLVLSIIVVIATIVGLVEDVQIIPLWLSPIISLVSLVFGFLFYNGLLILAKRFDAKLLKVMVIIGIVMIILSGIFGFIGGVLQMSGMVTALDDSGTMDDGSDLTLDSTITDEQATAAIALVMVLVLVFILILIASAATILTGVGMLKLKDKVKYAKAAAILSIIAGATYIILVGFLISFVVYVFQIMMLFEASKKFEKK